MVTIIIPMYTDFIRVLISGSRDWTNEDLIRNELLKLNPQKTIIVHGDCPTGADHIADLLANNMGFAVEKYPVEWEKYGKRAGPLRNQQMVDICDRLIAFPLPQSRGTIITINMAKKKGIPIDIIDER